MTNPITGQVTYTPAQVTNASTRAGQAVSKERFADLLKSITPEEAGALTDAFGPASPTSKVTGDSRGRHLDIRA